MEKIVKELDQLSSKMKSLIKMNDILISKLQQHQRYVHPSHLIDFTNSDMEDVKDLLEEGLTVEEIADELNFDVNKVEQIISSLRKSQTNF